MAEFRLGEIEMRFADIIWEKEPVSSGELVKICERELSWKKSTTYTVLRRICDRGLFQNEEGIDCNFTSDKGRISRRAERKICGRNFSWLPARIPCSIYKKEKTFR